MEHILREISRTSTTRLQKSSISCWLRWLVSLLLVLRTRDQMVKTVFSEQERNNKMKTITKFGMTFAAIVLMSFM